mmetsp:Transcript_11412/g.19261  ORF Transcript_11412/g.19261 Transcript_11412/m.19261 type:complete len:222 (-) Transcript_11412:345-1010(-)
MGQVRVNNLELMKKLKSDSHEGEQPQLNYYKHDLGNLQATSANKDGPASSIGPGTAGKGDGASNSDPKTSSHDQEGNRLELSFQDSDRSSSSSVNAQRLSKEALVTFGVAIILHSVIDGLAIGVFDDEKSVVVLVVSVIIHKIPVGCTLGTTFLSNSMGLDDKSSLAVFITFILASPAGIIVGMLIGDNANQLTLMAIQSLSGGTFIYLACCDLLVHEFHN